MTPAEAPAGGVILLLGTLDTKGEECRYLRDRLREHGCTPVTIDVGVLGRPGYAPEVSRRQVARAAGADLTALAAVGDRGAAIEAMGRGAAVVVRDFARVRHVAGAIAIGGSGGASVAARALATLPFGIPKVLVSTVAAGDTRPYVAGSDITMVHPVVDLAGLNPISECVLANAAAAVAGMSRVAAVPSMSAGGPVIALSMFGITTPCVERVRSALVRRGYVPIVFSANGVGGDAMEDLVAGGSVAGVADLTTTELADRLIGGALPAREDRLEAAGALGVPQVVAPGALDVVNFGPWDSVPERFRGRRLHRHNPEVTLMRTLPEECAELGRLVAAKLAAGRGPRCVVLPLRGLSTLSGPGGPFHDPVADRALFDALRSHLPAAVDLVEVDCALNDPVFADVVVDRLHAMCAPAQAQAPARAQAPAPARARGRDHSRRRQSEPAEAGENGR